MGFVKLECPGCGATLSIDESRDFCFCEFCGTRLERDKQIVELRGEVKVNGIATEETLLERAYIFLHDGDWQNAYLYFNKVLDVNPKKAEAYMGLLMARLQTDNCDELRTHDKDLNLYCNFRNAVKFSEGAEREKYLDINNDVIANMNAKDSSFADAVSVQQKAYSDAQAMADESVRAAQAAVYIKSKKYVLKWLYFTLGIPALILISVLAKLIAPSSTAYSYFVFAAIVYTVVIIVLIRKHRQQIKGEFAGVRNREMKKAANGFSASSAADISAKQDERAQAANICRNMLSKAQADYSGWKTYLEREE